MPACFEIRTRATSFLAAARRARAKFCRPPLTPADEARLYQWAVNAERDRYLISRTIAGAICPELKATGVDFLRLSPGEPTPRPPA